MLHFMWKKDIGTHTCMFLLSVEEHTKKVIAVVLVADGDGWDKRWKFLWDMISILKLCLCIYPCKYTVFHMRIYWTLKAKYKVICACQSN